MIPCASRVDHVAKGGGIDHREISDSALRFSDRTSDVLSRGHLHIDRARGSRR